MTAKTSRVIAFRYGLGSITHPDCTEDRDRTIGNVVVWQEGLQYYKCTRCGEYFEEPDNDSKD